jgi:hypothetical protein
MNELRKLTVEILNESLTASVVPSVTSSWQAIVKFAHTMNGDKAVGREKCARLANSVKTAFPRNAAAVSTLSLTELRLCLFFEQRRFNHFGHAPQGADREFINAILDAIQRKL